MKKDEMFSTKKCAICKKEIVRLYFGDYVYKDGAKYYCGWTCYRKRPTKVKNIVTD